MVTGLGLDYAKIIDMISTLCENGTIEAEFRLQRPDADILTGPQRAKGRPESEL